MGALTKIVSETAIETGTNSGDDKIPSRDDKKARFKKEGSKSFLRINF